MQFFKSAFYASKRAVEIAAMLMRAILQAILGIVAAICRLFGIRPPSMLRLPIPSTTPEDVRDEYRDEYTREVANDHVRASDVGMAVHQYASQRDPAIRGAVDLGGLSPSQTDWLLGLRDDDLQRLAQAGPKAAELAVTGKKCGIVGLPIPAADKPEIEGPNPVRDLLVDRIRRARGTALAQ